jgi:hypothetical protein
MRLQTCAPPRNSTVSNNSVGIGADQGAIVQVDQTTVTANGTGLAAANGAQLQSYGTNGVSGNATDGVPTITVALE